MKLHLALLALCGATLIAVGAAALVYHHSQAAATVPAVSNQVFAVTGQIISLEEDGKTARIAHDEIPGFMPAMEMPFTAKDPSALAGLAPGDLVKFQLTVTRDDSWIDRVEKLAASGGVTGTASAATSTPPRQVEVGRLVPDFGLVDQEGHPFQLRDFRCQAVVLTFIYTRCPLPNFCPLMSRNFASLEERFAKELPGKVQLMSISIDPEFDTPAVLKQYAAAFRKNDRNWTFATGSREQVDRVTSLFGLIREPSNGFINHDLRTALISPDGKLVHVWRSNVWTPYEVQRMAAEVFKTQLADSSRTAKP